MPEQPSRHARDTAELPIVGQAPSNNATDLRRRRYALAGLSLASDLPLVGLLASDTGDLGDLVTIRITPVPKGLPHPIVQEEGVAFDGHALLLDIPEVARFLIRDGITIEVDPYPDSDPNDVRAFLLGSVFGTLCHQRGIVPLHSAAIDTAGGCVAFVGQSRAGKSTLAAALSGRGHQIIADDVSFLRSSTSGSILCWPGISRIRLWEDALLALGRNGPEVQREFRGYNKYLVPVAPPKDRSSPRSLRRIYNLRAAPVGAKPQISRVTGASAVELLMQGLYCSELAEYMGRMPESFLLCVAAAREIPVFDFSRPIDFHALDEGLRLLEEHLRRDIPG